MGIVFTGVRETWVANRGTVVAVDMANRGFMTGSHSLDPFGQMMGREITQSRGRRSRRTRNRNVVWASMGKAVRMARMPMT